MNNESVPNITWILTHNEKIRILAKDQKRKTKKNLVVVIFIKMIHICFGGKTIGKYNFLESLVLRYL